MSPPLREGLAALAQQARGEAAAVAAKVPELAALARAGAILAKRCPERRHGAVASSQADGSLEARLRAALGDAADLSKLTPLVAGLLHEEVEACAEELLQVTDASVKAEAGARGRAAALGQGAAAMEALLAVEERPAAAEATPAAPQAAEGHAEAP